MKTRLAKLTLVFPFLFPASSGAQATPDLQVQKHFQAARQADQAGDHPRATGDEYQAVLRLQPEIAEAQNDVGVVYYL